MLIRADGPHPPCQALTWVLLVEGRDAALLQAPACREGPRLLHGRTTALMPCVLQGSIPSSEVLPICPGPKGPPSTETLLCSPLQPSPHLLQLPGGSCQRIPSKAYKPQAANFFSVRLSSQSQGEKML